MKLNIKNGRILRIEEQELNPVLPTSDLSFIQDKDLFKEIRNYIKSDHNKLENKFSFQEGLMKGSNPYLAVAIDMYFKKHAPTYRVATQSDLEKDLDFTKGTYNDTGLALRNLTGSNSEKAEHIFKQLKHRGIKIEDFPIWLNLRELELDKNLNFNLTDESVYKTQPQLNWENGTRYSKVNDLGLPKEKDKNSNRQIWTSNHALSRCYLNRCSNLLSDDSDLSYSSDNGRVVVSRKA